MDINQSIQKRFGEAANQYAVAGVLSTGPDFERLIQAAELKGHERVLDLATGTAHTALAFAPHVQEVVGLDLTQAMLEAAANLARERGVDNLILQKGLAEALPFPDACFDLVVARQGPHHFRAIGKAICEAARVLKPGGIFAVIDSISLDDPLLDTFMNAVEILRDSSHVRNHNLAQWRGFCEVAGMRVEAQDAWRVRLEFDDWLERGGTSPTASAQLRQMFDTATAEVREAYEIDTPRSYDFSLPVGLTKARL
ncbi:MAG: methyltransferase domain-containing protein [bacterium]|nr:methyltransferase domain-containing protein [bacterium]